MKLEAAFSLSIANFTVVAAAILSVTALPSLSRKEGVIPLATRVAALAPFNLATTSPLASFTVNVVLFTNAFLLNTARFSALILSVMLFKSIEKKFFVASATIL